MDSPAKLVVLISGQGSNLQAIINACHCQQLNAKIKAVLSNKPHAYGLKRAKLAKLKTLVLPSSPQQSRLDYDRTLATQVAELKPDWIVLAGWMRILSEVFLACFRPKVINLHPALPNSFPGIRAIERAWAAYQRGEIQSTGIMVHQVLDDGIDCGPVLAQVEVPINPNDSLISLTTRMQQAERRLLVHTLQALINNSSLSEVER